MPTHQRHEQHIGAGQHLGHSPIFDKLSLGKPLLLVDQLTLRNMCSAAPQIEGERELAAGRHVDGGRGHLHQPRCMSHGGEA